jgi:hypothetical protein
VRESLAEDLADIERGQGKIPDTRTIEAIVDEDIRHHDAMEREQKWQPPLPKKKNAPDTPLSKAGPAEGRWATKDEARAANKEAEVRPYRDDFAEGTDPTPKACTCGVCRICKMRMRLAYLVQPGDAGRPMFPVWFRRVNDELFSWKLGVGPYRELKVSEGKPMLQRRLEQICDESNSLIGLGGWWVK